MRKLYKYILKIIIFKYTNRITLQLLFKWVYDSNQYKISDSRTETENLTNCDRKLQISKSV